MSVKKVVVDGVGEVHMYRKTGVKNIRLSVAANGQIRVSMPRWTPYGFAIDFVKTKSDWLLSQAKSPAVIIDRQPIGKAHHIQFQRGTGTRPSATIKGSVISVSLPPGMNLEDEAAQAAAKRAAVKALKKEATLLLPQRLKTLAEEYGFIYNSVAIKSLKGRWGSCSHQKDIIFNCYLMQLPWHLIDYVIIHELVHTRIMAHGAPFWQEVAQYVPNLPNVRAQMRSYQPTI